MTDFVTRVCGWFVAAQQQPKDPTPSAQQAAFYTGMQLEELAEKLEVILGASHPLVTSMHSAGHSFKDGKMDSAMANAMVNSSTCESMLDADIDLLWVSIGAARAQGADVIGACNEVARANWDKAVDGIFQLSDTKRVLKRPGWTPPDLQPFMHVFLRKAGRK